MPNWLEYLELSYWCCVLAILAGIVLAWFGNNNDRTGH